MRGVGKGEDEDRREKNRKRRTIRRVFKKTLHSRTSRLKMKMKKKVEIGKEE